MKRLFVLAAAATALFTNAQTFPGSKPISIVVPFVAGSPTDRVARDLAEAMTTIPFGGTAPAMNALVGGQVDLMCDQTTNTTNTTSQIEASGKFSD
jgi:tripartite-type tricarboxylate transporter receptor subunit TctC